MPNSQKIKFYLKDTDNYLLFSALFFLLIGIYFRFEALEVVRITEWVARDFDRAFHLFDGNYIPLAGSERNAGGRLWGPFLYFFTAIPLLFNYSYESIYVFNLILNVGSILFTCWLVHKYFGVVTASIVSILLSVNVVHLDSVGLPINPTFMLPALFVYLWLLFKVAIENKTSYVPWVFVTISLGIQMHFSMATYYLVPLVVCLLFKIKIPLRQIFVTFVLTSICFIPYLIYKQQYYEVNLEITKTFFNQDYSFLSLLKIISLQNVFHRINQGTSLYGYYSVPDYIVQIEFYFSTISFYGLILFVAFRASRNSIQFCKKEIIIILAFYIPALIYEITNPPTGWHFWHYFIFVPLTILIKGRFCGLIIESISLEIYKNSVIALFVFFIGCISFKNLKNVYLQNFTSDVIIKNENFYISKNLKNNLGALMNALSLSPKEFYEKVYFHGIPVGSLKYLEFSKGDSFNSKKNSDVDVPCFFIVVGEKVENGKFYLNNEFLNSRNSHSFKILDDTSLDIKSPQILKGDEYGLANVFMVYRYKSKLDQPCYTNTKNAFAVGTKIDHYLKDSFGVNKNVGDEVIIKKLTEQVVFDDTSRLNKFKKEIIVFNPKVNTPIQVSISIESLNDKYRVRTELLYYSWGKEKRDHFMVKQLDLKITNINQTSAPIINSIINPDSWIANKPIDSVTENFSWYREFDFPKNFELKKDKFQIQLFWDIRFPGKKDNCCLTFETNIPN